MQIWINKPERVSISDTQAKDIAIETLYGLLGGDGIEDFGGTPWVYKWDTQHGSGLTDYIREATEEDKAIVIVIKLLKSKISHVQTPRT